MGSKTALLSAVLMSSGLAAGSAVGQTTIIQSNVGSGCSSVCINGTCTSTCDDTGTDARKGNGDVVEREIDLKDFQEVVSTDIDTTISQGESFSVSVSADSNLQDHIKVSKEGGVLAIKLENGQYQDATIKVDVVMPDLRKLTQRGAADLKFSGFDQSTLELNIAGAGTVTGDDNMVTNLVLNTDGATQLDLHRSELTNAEIHATGTSNIRLNFSGNEGTLSGRVDGVSEVQYCGDPVNKVAISGVADIRKVSCS